MNNPIPSTKQNRLADARDLERIQWTINQLAGTGSLKPLARNWLSFCVALARLGYTGIKAPIAAVTRAQYRSVAQTRSDSSTHRGLGLLEQAGYIRRKKLRLGPDRFASEIIFNMPRFDYWLMGEVSHIAPQLSKCEETEVTSKALLVNPCNYSPNSDTKPPRANDHNGELVNKGSGDSGKNKHRYHPIVFSLKCITRGSLLNFILARAVVELQSRAMRTSGVDWPRHEAQWSKLYHGEREHIARTEIMPRLAELAPSIVPRASIDKSGVSSKARISPQFVKYPPLSPPAQTAPGPNSIQDMLRNTAIGQALTIQSEGSEGQVKSDPDLTGADLAILRQARTKAGQGGESC